MAAELLRTLGTLLQSEVRDPRLAGISLSEVEVARDLSVARVYFVAAEPDNVTAAEEALRKASGYLRRQAAQVLRMRSVPELRFQHDDSLDRGDRVEALLARSRRRD